MAYPTRPFWAGLDPDKPERLDKVLAALHCYQVAPPSGSSFYFEFTVDRQDRHRLANGFPELQKLAAAINKKIAFEYNPSTGKLSTMSLERALAGVKYAAYYAIAASLDSSSDLPAPRSLLAAKLMVLPMEGDADALATFPIGLPPDAPTTMVAFTATGSPSKYAESFINYPSLRTVAVVKLALPMREIDIEKQMKRLAECSYVSVFTRVDGKVKETVHRNPLSAPGGAIKLWLSDLVEQDDLKGLPHECVRPLYNKGGSNPGDITIPYTTILTALQRTYAVYCLSGKEIDGSIDGSGGGSGGNVVRPDSGGKRFSSTAAGGNTGDNTFAKIVGGGGAGKRPMSTLSALVAFNIVNSNTGGYNGGKRFLSGYAASRRPAESTVFRPRPLYMVKLVGAIASSWIRLLARLPRKV
ncbi:hypothetical protein B0T24DRAFT_627790 [Lasiosphaeria ovina]|uniref:Uncharacterized protein n=1 Tax=Lasiosphaeria ovina TaxID=92902 RepID=A0AAE0N6D8_9PEZI|nr:hypothetical protein B0T24DRAFT_627790 [Lasiosphaeria ovina]